VGTVAEASAGSGVVFEALWQTKFSLSLAIVLSINARHAASIFHAWNSAAARRIAPDLAAGAIFDRPTG
jgi:hypothetical protein